MPLWLEEPREGKGPNYRIRGTYLGISVDRSSGSSEKHIARKELRKVKTDIECGRYAAPDAATFASAARDYIKAGGDRRFLEPLLLHFGNKPLVQLDQAEIDKAAVGLYPDATPATRNRQVYTPVSAVLKFANVTDKLRRPKGARGKKRMFFLQPEQAHRLIKAADAFDAELGLFYRVLLYTGCRLNEGLNMQIESMSLREGWVWVAETKNDDPRLVHLPPVAVAAIASHPRGLDRKGKLWRFTKSGRLYKWFDAIALSAGVEVPPRVAFHAFRHTYGAWMRRYGGLDTTGLVETGTWKSREAAAVYEHAVQSEEARKADMLPIVGGANPPPVLMLPAPTEEKQTG